MIKSIKLEFFKIRHRKMYITTLAIMGILFVWTLYAQSNMKIVLEEAQGWMNIFYNLALMNCIFMPILTAVIASKLVDIEHKGNTLKLLKTVQGSTDLFKSKLICGIIIMSSTVLIEGITIFVLGFISKYLNIPLNHLIYFMFYTFIIDITLFLLQMILSFIFVNQMIPFIVAITGSFLGLFSLFFGGVISKLIIWSYYGVMSPCSMSWDESTRISTFTWNAVSIKNIILMVLLFIILYILGQKSFSRREE